MVDLAAEDGGVGPMSSTFLLWVIRSCGRIQRTWDGGRGGIMGSYVLTLTC